MWPGILAILFYYIVYSIMFLTEGTAPGARFLGKKLVFYDNLAIFIILPLSLLFSIWAFIKGVISLNKTKGIAPSINITCGVATICLFVLSFFIFFVDALSFGGPFILFSVKYIIFLVCVAIFLIYLYYRFKRQLSHEKV